MASITSVINAAGKISNTLFDLSPKSFYSIADFYNFIKKRQNAPMARKHFTMVPRQKIWATDAKAIPIIWDKLFNDKNLAKFAITAQDITYPKEFGLTDTNGQISNAFGNYSYTVNNAALNSNSKSFTISFLQTAEPIIQKFIVPWMFECNRTYNHDQQVLPSTGDYFKDLANSAVDTINNVVSKFTDNSKYKLNRKYKVDPVTKPISQYPCPKLDLDIKFYRMDQIAGLEFLMNPTFVYRITDVYPISIQPATATHSGEGASIVNRMVTFKFNNFLCIPDVDTQMNIVSNTNIAFAYREMSPIQILNKLNQAAGGIASVASNVKGMF